MREPNEMIKTELREFIWGFINDEYESDSVKNKFIKLQQWAITMEYESKELQNFLLAFKQVYYKEIKDGTHKG